MGSARPTFEMETERGPAADRRVMGVDEAGRGAWAGPVVVAAVSFRDPGGPGAPPWAAKRLNDSKKLTARAREELAVLLREAAQADPPALDMYVAEVPPSEVDRLNVLAATMKGMRECIAAVRAARPDESFAVLVDGDCSPLPVDPLCETVVRGDSRCLCIAAASVLAKVRRDEIMRDLARENPGYGWETNVGYGTKSHMKGLRELGPCLQHRTSYAPVALRALAAPAVRP